MHNLPTITWQLLLNLHFAILPYTYILIVLPRHWAQSQLPSVANYFNFTIATWCKGVSLLDRPIEIKDDSEFLNHCIWSDMFHGMYFHRIRMSIHSNQKRLVLKGSSKIGMHPGSGMFKPIPGMQWVTSGSPDTLYTHKFILPTLHPYWVTKHNCSQVLISPATCWHGWFVECWRLYM